MAKTHNDERINNILHYWELYSQIMTTGDCHTVGKDLTSQHPHHRNNDKVQAAKIDNRLMRSTTTTFSPPLVNTQRCILGFCYYTRTFHYPEIMSARKILGVVQSGPPRLAMAFIDTGLLVSTLCFVFWRHLTRTAAFTNINIRRCVRKLWTWCCQRTPRYKQAHFFGCRRIRKVRMSHTRPQ